MDTNDVDRAIILDGEPPEQGKHCGTRVGVQYERDSPYRIPDYGS